MLKRFNHGGHSTVKIAYWRISRIESIRLLVLVGLVVGQRSSENVGPLVVVRRRVIRPGAITVVTTTFGIS